jgi:serine/threonine protein kinase
MAGELADTPYSLGDALPGADDPDVRRVRAIVQSRLLGEEPVRAKIDRFVLIDNVGEGGMGVVFAAFDPQLDRKVAIKLLRRGHDDARVVREAQAMAKLSHPNVAQVYEVGTHEGRTFIAMEFVRGTTLRRWCAEQTRGWREIVTRYVEAGRGLAAAHAAGLVHRDFKPDNAVVGDDRVRVVDFGLARADATSEVTLLTTTDASPTTSVAGTPRYMAPEQRAGGDADAKSDQYSFCVSLWEALHDALPFDGAKTAAPTWIRAALTRGLSMASGERFASMNALIEALLDDPSRKRARRLAFGGATLVAAAIVGAWALHRAAAIRACESETLADTWGPDARTRLREAVVGTGLVYAPDTWARLEPQLDAYADRWAVVRAQTCIAATVEGDRSDELAARTTACLEDRRDALGTLVDVLSTSEPAPIQNALQSAYGLPAIDSCSSDAWLLSRPTPPPDEAARELAREVAKSEWLRATLDSKPYLDDAKAIATRTEALGFEPLHARALMNLGAYQSEADDHTGAEASLREAVTIALHSNVDDIAVDAAVGMVVSAGTRDDHEEALWWGWLGQTLLDRSTDPDPARAVHLLAQLAAVHQRRRAFVEADAALEQARATAEEAFGEGHPLVARVTSQLGMMKGELGRLPEARALLERALALQERALGPDHPMLAQTLGGIGSTLVLHEEWAAAIPPFERALAIHEATHGPDHPLVAELLNVLASAYSAAGQHERGLAARARSLAIAERVYGPDNVELLPILVNGGAVHSDRGEYDEAMADFERALRIAEPLGETRNMDVGMILANMAQVHDLRGEPARAIEIYPRALDLLVTSLGKEHLRVAYVVEQFDLAREHARSRTVSPGRDTTGP